jgi:hypothetical protein
MSVTGIHLSVNARVEQGKKRSRGQLCLPLSYSRSTALCSVNVQLNSSLSPPLFAYQSDELWMGSYGRRNIPIQYKLPEKPAVFLWRWWRRADGFIDRFYRSGIPRKVGDWTV